MNINKTYLPGDRWIFFRIYTGYRIADKLLLSVLVPLAGDLIKKELASEWFFIRYADPDFHLRFRLRLRDNQAAAMAMSMLQAGLQPYVDTRQVWKVEISDYRPELERYGRNTLRHAEKLFYHDSVAYGRFMLDRHAGKDENARWQYAMAAADLWLNDFAFTLQQKKDLLKDLSRNFGKEFGKEANLARQLSEKFRKRREEIILIMEKANSQPWKSILLARSADTRHNISAIMDLNNAGHLEVDLNDFLASIIHMSINRIFQTHNRLYEMLLYDFLFRYYKSRLATTGISSFQHASTTSGMLVEERGSLLKFP